MPIDFSALDRVDRLTSKELAGLSPEEWVDISAVRDFIADSRAEASAWEEANAHAEQANPPQPKPTSLANGVIWAWRFVYMCRGWNLYGPDNPDGSRGAPIPFTPENVDKLFRVYGLQLTAQMLIRGGGIAGPPVKKVGPDGENAEFQEGSQVPS
jgi:hypothetical protein